MAARSGTVGVAGPRGHGPARHVVGRKRYALVDTDGLLLGGLNWSSRHLLFAPLAGTGSASRRVFSNQGSCGAGC